MRIEHPAAINSAHPDQCSDGIAVDTGWRPRRPSMSVAVYACAGPYGLERCRRTPCWSTHRAGGATRVQHRGSTSAGQRARRRRTTLSAQRGYRSRWPEHVPHADERRSAARRQCDEHVVSRSRNWISPSKPHRRTPFWMPCSLERAWSARSVSTTRARVGERGAGVVTSQVADLLVAEEGGDDDVTISTDAEPVAGGLRREVRGIDTYRSSNGAARYMLTVHCFRT